MKSVSYVDSDDERRLNLARKCLINKFVFTNVSKSMLKLNEDPNFRKFDGIDLFNQLYASLTKHLAEDGLIAIIFEFVYDGLKTKNPVIDLVSMGVQDQYLCSSRGITFFRTVNRR